MANHKQHSAEEADIEEQQDHHGVESTAASELSLPISRWLVLCVPLFAILATGSKAPWALGMFSCLVGICFLFAPPKMRVSPAVLVPLFLMLCGCLVVLIPSPVSWHSEWRAALVNELGISLAPSATPQPWVTLESWVLLTVGVLWLLHCLGRGFGKRERRFFIYGLVLLIAAVAVTAMFVKMRGIVVPVWRLAWGLAYYGPFPNRNSFSSLLAMGAVLAFASTYDAYKNKSALWPVLGLALVPMFVAILFNTSRAGVVLFFVGLGVWMLTAAFHKRSAQRVSVFASLLIILATGFILFGQEILGRFGWGMESGVTTGVEGRANIFFDTMLLVGLAPMFGVGLGNFDSVFALTQLTGNAATRNYHPESDWTWFLAECGVIPLLLGVIAMVNIFRRTGPWRASDSPGKRDRRLRNATGLCAMLVAFHGLVDTPAHSLGIWATVALLLGLALRPNRQAAWRGRITPWLHRAAAVFCIGAGMNWLSISLLGKGLPGDSYGRSLFDQSQQLANSGDYAGAVDKVTKALAVKPMQHHYYFWRAKWLLDLGASPQSALADFTRARHLEPHNGPLCFEELQSWLAHNQPQYAVPAMREIFLRDHKRSMEYYSAALSEMNRFPELREPMRLLAVEPPQKLLYLSHTADKKDFEEVLQSLLELMPSLDALTSKDRRTLFRLWYAKGNRDRLLAILEKNPDWRQDGWPVLAEHRAASGDYQGAYQLAADLLEPPFEATPSRSGDINQLKRSFLFNPTDIARGLELFEALKSRDAMLDEAELTLEKVARLPGAPAKVAYEQARLFARKGDFAKAWAKMKTYMEQLPRDNS